MTTVTLNNLKNLSGEFVSPPPSIYTGFRLKIDGSHGSVPLTCASIIATTNSYSRYEALLSTYNIEYTINRLRNFIESVTNNDIDQRQIIDATSENLIQEYLNSLTSIDIPLLTLVNTCLRETKLPVDSIEYNDAKQQLDTSKERLELIKTPEQRVSYYEGWFPLFRPMNRSALFGIFGAGLFLLLLSILLFLRLQGVEILLKFPELSIGSPSGFSIPSSYKLWAAGGLLAGGLIGYFGYKWFSA